MVMTESGGVQIIGVPQQGMDQDNLRGCPELRPLWPNCLEPLPQIDGNQRQVHLIPWNDEWHLLLDQTSAVVGRDLLPHVDDRHARPDLDLVDVLSDRGGGFCTPAVVHQNQARQAQDLGLEESVAILQEERHTAAGLPRQGGQGDSKGFLEVALCPGD
jgi:hypothetical protein